MTNTSVTKLLLNRMDEKDLEEVMQIEEACFPVPWSWNMFLSEVTSNPYSLPFVAREPGSGRLIGYLCLWEVCEEIHVMNLAVHPRFQRQGIGEDFLRWALDSARKRGAREASLEVRASNMAARRLYEKVGFRVASVRPGYYQKPMEDALVMRLFFGDGGKAMVDDNELIIRLRKENKEFQELEKEHQELEKQLDELKKKRALTAEEELQVKRIKKEKLTKKDRMAAILRLHKK